MPELPFSVRGALSRAFVSLYFFVLIRIGIRLSERQGRRVYDLVRIERQIESWEARLVERPWLSGEALGFLDFAFLGHVQCMASGLTDELLPILRRQEHLMAWLERMVGVLPHAAPLYARRVLDPAASVPSAGTGERILFWAAWLGCLCVWPLTGTVLLLLLARRQKNPGHSGAVVARSRGRGAADG